MFEQAYREGGNASVEDSGKSNVKLSLSEQKSPTYDELVAKNPTRIVKVTEGIESATYSVMKEAALNKATSEGWFDAPHHNDDTDSLIFITEKSFRHAFNNLNAYFGEDTIRSMAHIPEIIKEAVLVNVADPKTENRREKKVYTFFAAIEGKNGIEPVKLTVKEFDFTSMDTLPKNIKSYFEKNGIIDSYNSLYDTHALEVIGIEGIKKESDASGKGNGIAPLAQSTSDSTISIADLLNLVKGDAEKYIPKSAKKSLSNDDKAPVRYGNFNISGEDVRLEAPAAKKIHIISARKIKSGNGQVLNVKSDDSPQPTSETLLDGITATNSITDFDGKVNTSYEKISETGDPEGSANEKTAKVFVGKSKTEKRKNRVWEN